MCLQDEVAAQITVSYLACQTTTTLTRHHFQGLGFYVLFQHKPVSGGCDWTDELNNHLLDGVQASTSTQRAIEQQLRTGNDKKKLAIF